MINSQRLFSEQLEVGSSLYKAPFLHTSPILDCFCFYEGQGAPSHTDMKLDKASACINLILLINICCNEVL